MPASLLFSELKCNLFPQVLAKTRFTNCTFCICSGPFLVIGKAFPAGTSRVRSRRSSSSRKGASPEPSAARYSYFHGRPTDAGCGARPALPLKLPRAIGPRENSARSWRFMFPRRIAEGGLSLGLRDRLRGGTISSRRQTWPAPPSSGCVAGGSPEAISECRGDSTPRGTGSGRGLVLPGEDFFSPSSKVCPSSGSGRHTSRERQGTVYVGTVSRRAVRKVPISVDRA
jgi:hypothetical protein